MEYQNILTIKHRSEFRAWLINHAASESECWLLVKRGKPIDDVNFWYIDAVEEALCFGWIDGKFKKIDGIVMQRFSPRKPKSIWTELNKERVKRLEKLGLMTDLGRRVLPNMGKNSFKIDPDIETALKHARVWTKFKSFHSLYQRVRAYNLFFYKKYLPNSYEKALNHLIETTRRGKMYGEWNDYGRLLEY